MTKLLIIILAFGTAFAASSYNGGVPFQSAPALTIAEPEYSAPAVVMKRDIATGEYKANYYGAPARLKREAEQLLEGAVRHLVANAPAHLNKRETAAYLEHAITQFVENVPPMKVKRSYAPELAASLSDEGLRRRDDVKHVEKRTAYYGYPYYGRYGGYNPYRYYPQQNLYYPNGGFLSYLSYL